MRCSRCGTEMGGKRYCPECNFDNQYEGSVPVKFATKRNWIRIVRRIFTPSTIFIAVCVAVVITRYIMQNG